MPFRLLFVFWMPPLVIPTNTTQLVAEIKDRGLFEMLVRRVLQIAAPEYRGIIQTGTNKFGETITAPIDGIGRNGNQYALLETTTTDKKKLTAKWLSTDPKSEGDLLKAGREAAKIRNDNPAAIVTVVMATNEPVDEELFLAVQTRGDSLGVLVDIWDQSRIANVLDTDPAGQALRTEYLGIQATLVSRELLAILAAESARRHGRTLLTEPDAVPRSLADDVCRTLAGSEVTLRLLRGSSGLGKSTAAHHVMRRWIEDGDIALWLPETTLQSSSSLESALETLLAELNGKPLIDAAESLLALTDAEHPLVLIVDDIRQLAAPGAALRKLITWARPAEDERPRVRFVVPVWPQMTDEVHAELRDAPWIDVVEVGPFAREESVERVRAASMSTADAEMFAALLGDDPFLIGRWRDLVRRGTEPSAHLARHVLETFVHDALTEVTGAVPLLDVEELEQTLVRIARWMMELRELHPSPGMLRKELTERGIAVVAALAGQSRILTWRTDAAGRRTIAFRHDRLEEHFFSRAVIGILGDSDPARVIADPYFARAVGLALAAGAIEHLPRVAAEAPLAMFEALRFATDRDRRQIIIDAAAQWLAPGEPHFELQRAILLALREAEGEGLGTLSSLLPEREQQQLVRLHHGDATAALPILERHEFLPAVTYKAFEKAVEHARSHHRAAMSDAVQTLLQGDATARYGLQLAGYLAVPELAQPILETWERSSKDYDNTVAALWAAARCCDAGTADVIGPLFDYYVSLAEQRYDDNVLNLAFKLSPSPAAAAAIVERASADTTARKHALWTLNKVDHPEVFRMFVEDAEERALNHAVFATDARPSAESRDMLRTLWQSTEVQEYGRKSALMVWAASATTADIRALREHTDDPLLGPTITRIRARLGDRSAAPALAELGSTDAGSLIWAHRVWSPELREAVEEHLRAFAAADPARHPDDPHHIARVLRHVPAADAEELFEAHWPTLRTSPLFIQSAIVVGTPRTLSLAHAAVEALPPDEYAFRHVGQRFGFWHTKDRQHRGAVPETVLTTRHLASLLEFAPAMRRSEIEDVLSAAVRRGWFSWLEANFERWIAHLPEEDRASLRTHYLPTDDDLRARLQELRQTQYPAHYWVKDIAELDIDPRRAIDVVVSAACEESSTDAWDDVITVLAHVGTRADFARIEPRLPANDDVRAAFEDIAFAIHRRTLQ